MSSRLSLPAGPGTTLERLREHERPAVLVGAAFGIGVSLVHPVGLVAGGLLVAVPAASMGRAVGYGLGFGVVVWLLFATALALDGLFEAYLGMGQLTLLSAGAALGLPLLGALVGRGFT